MKTNLYWKQQLTEKIPTGYRLEIFKVGGCAIFEAGYDFNSTFTSRRIESFVVTVTLGRLRLSMSFLHYRTFRLQETASSFNAL